MLVGYYYKLKGLFTRFRALTGGIDRISARVPGAGLGDKMIEARPRQSAKRDYYIAFLMRGDSCSAQSKRCWVNA